MYFCPKSLCDERSYARHARYFAAGDSSYNRNIGSKMMVRTR